MQDDSILSAARAILQSSGRVLLTQPEYLFMNSTAPGSIATTRHFTMG